MGRRQATRSACDSGIAGREAGDTGEEQGGGDGAGSAREDWKVQSEAKVHGNRGRRRHSQLLAAVAAPERRRRRRGWSENTGGRNRDRREHRTNGFQIGIRHVPIHISNWVQFGATWIERCSNHFGTHPTNHKPV
uniref:Uncharacterized protein n=1 Tax=Physcomitrium patens TaxID=3218 RepID=A0A2K1JVB4_PHYPA|nr:hypothetical protein PHYPA_015239 [Physcomitrium patens]PNR45469.1 hypothetical protein PHYPA_015240 [Physcomitrium patens]